MTHGTGENGDRDKVQKVSSTFLKVAGSKGSALGRAPQSAERLCGR